MSHESVREQLDSEASVMRSSAWLLAASVTMAAGNALFNLVLARAAGPAGYSLAFPLLTLGTASAAIGVGFQYATTHSVLSGLSGKAAWQAVRRGLLMAGALTLGVLSFIEPLSHALHVENPAYLAIAALLFAATFALAGATGYLVALGRFVAIAVISAVSAAIRVLMFLGLAHWLVVRGSLLASFLATGLSALAMWTYGSRKGAVEIPSAPVQVTTSVSGSMAIGLFLSALTALPSWGARYFLPGQMAGVVSMVVLLASGITVLAGPIAATTFRSIALGGHGRMVAPGTRVTILMGLVGVIGMRVAGPSVASLLSGQLPAILPQLLLLFGLAAAAQALVGFLVWTSQARGEPLWPWLSGVLCGLAAESAAMGAWHSARAVALAALLGSCLALVAGSALSRFERIREEDDAQTPTASRRLLSEQMLASMSLGEPVVAVSVGVLAHNEREMIGVTVSGFLGQLRGRTHVAEVVVIVSGSTDGTPEVVEGIAARDARVRAIIQPQRLGKIRAVEDFLQLARHDLCVVTSGDIVPESDAVERLCCPMLDDPEIGMVGPRVASQCFSFSFIARMHQALWRLHDRVAIRSPKIGETYGVRRPLVGPLMPVAGCDEVLVEAAVTEAGGRLFYARDALVHNFAPTSMSEYFDHRRRIHVMHLSAAAAIGYRPSTLSLSRCLQAIVVEAAMRPSSLPTLVTCCFVELLARSRARADAARGETEMLWARTVSSRLTVAEALAEPQLTRQH